MVRTPFRHAGWWFAILNLKTLGSVISISPLYSMDCNGLDADFAKTPI